MCVVREFLGKGSFGGGLCDLSQGFLRRVLDGTGTGIPIVPSEYGAMLLILPFGGFLTLGCLIALMQYALTRSAEKKERARRAALEANAVKEAAE